MLEPLEGPVHFAHQFVNMPNYTVEVEDPVNGLTKVRNNEQNRKLTGQFTQHFDETKSDEAMYAGFRLCVCCWMCGWCGCLRFYTGNNFR